MLLRTVDRALSAVFAASEMGQMNDGLLRFTSSRPYSNQMIISNNKYCRSAGLERKKSREFIIFQWVARRI